MGFSIINQLACLIFEQLAPVMAAFPQITFISKVVCKPKIFVCKCGLRTGLGLRWHNSQLRAGSWKSRRSAQQQKTILCRAKTAEAQNKAQHDKSDKEAIDDILNMEEAPNEQCTITNQLESDTKLKVYVTVPESVVKWVDTCTLRYLNDILEKSNQVPDGFRAGKIPRKQLYYHYGKKTVEGQVVTILTQQCFDVVKEQAPPNVIGDSLTVVDQEQLVENYVPNKEFQFQIEMDLQPSIKWLQDYKSIKMEVPNIESTVNLEQQADVFIRNCLKKKGQLRQVGDRGVQQSDVLVMSYKAERADDGQSIPGMRRENYQHDLEEDLVPGFAENLIGSQKGEEKVFQVVFPQDWEPKQISGVQLKFTVTVHDILEYDLPEVNQEIAEEISGGVCKKPEELRDYMIQQFQYRLKQEQMNLIIDALTEKIAGMVELQVPEYTLMENARTQYSNKLLQAAQKGQISEQALKQMMTEDLVKDYYYKNKDQIEAQIKIQYAFDDICEKEDIQVDEEEVRRQVQQIQQSLKQKGIDSETYVQAEILDAKLHEFANFFLQAGAVEFAN
eukprot:TRINITY_DN847_c1_g1_i3.p1 TRINITY_DN847_c1_g1~~TRINITY_DN847_c1_g1_i3.p1  ORF type:complete len:589 (-),score=75.00 TRINITY_DN847_c1_g1_i3:727-2403(-)